MSIPVPTESPKDINHGRLYSEWQIRAAFIEWCADFKANPDAYQEGDSTDGEACASHLIEIIKKQSH